MLNKGNKGKHETLHPCNIQSRHGEKAFSGVKPQPFAHRAKASAEQKTAETPGRPLCSEPAAQAAQGHGSNLKACFLHPNIMSGQTALHPAII